MISVPGGTFRLKVLAGMAGSGPDLAEDELALVPRPLEEDGPAQEPGRLVDLEEDVGIIAFGLGGQLDLADAGRLRREGTVLDDVGVTEGHHPEEDAEDVGLQGLLGDRAPRELLFFGQVHLEDAVLIEKDLVLGGLVVPAHAVGLLEEEIALLAQGLRDRHGIIELLEAGLEGRDGLERPFEVGHGLVGRHGRGGRGQGGAKGRPRGRARPR